MTRVALDSNILIYAKLDPESDKGKIAIEALVSKQCTNSCLQNADATNNRHG